MRIDWQVGAEEDRNAIEAKWMQDGWTCIYRTGIDPGGEDHYPKTLLWVWQYGGHNGKKAEHRA